MPVSVTSGSPRGYGPRDDAGRDAPLVGSSSRVVLRARPSVALFGLVVLAFPVWLFAQVGIRAFPGLFFHPKVLLLCVVGLVGGAQAVWLVFFPILRADPGGLHARPLLFRPRATYPRSGIVWYPKQRWVGPYLLARLDGLPVRVPIWLLSRASQRRLFAWLDATARAEVPP